MLSAGSGVLSNFPEVTQLLRDRIRDLNPRSSGFKECPINQ